MAGLTDEELKVVISATTAEFSKAMAEAREEMVAFGKAGTKSFNSATEAEKSLASQLTKGKTRTELKLIAAELGGMAGASGLAGNQVSALMNALSHLTSPIGLAVAGAAALASGLAFLVEKHKKAKEEAEKQAAADAKLAENFDRAAVAGAKLTRVQVDMLRLVQEGQLRTQEELKQKLALVTEEYEEQRGKLVELQVAMDKGGERDRNAIDAHEEQSKVVKDLIDQRTRLTFALEGGTKALELETEAARLDQEELKKEDDFWKVALADRERRNAAFDKSVEAHNKMVAASFKRTQKEIENFRSATAPFQRDFVDMISAAAAGTQRLSDVWSKFAKDFVKDAERMILNKAVTKLFDMLGSFLFGAGTDNTQAGKGQGLLGGLLKKIPIFGGLFADGGSFTTKGPTMFMAGEGDDPIEHVTVTKNGQSGGGGISIGQLVISGGGARTRSESYALGLSQAAGLADGLARLDLRRGVRN